MQISVKFVARLKELAGTDQIVVDLPAGATVGSLMGALKESSPGLSRISTRDLVIMANQQIVAPEKALQDGDQIMLLQILGGG